MTREMRRYFVAPLVAALAIAAAACDDGKRYDQALCVLIDVSGTYAKERGEVVRILKSEVLPSMVPGDTLLVMRIDGQSYDKDNVELLVTLDGRPSRANAEKLGIAQHLDAMVGRKMSANHTDIPGAMMLGGEYLNEIVTGSRVMVIFSDMEEDLAPGAEREFAADEFSNTHFVAMNVKRLKGDKFDPQGFRLRLDAWEKRVLAAGGRSWRTFMDSGRLADHLANIRDEA